MGLSDDNKTFYQRADYEKLYHTAVGYIANIHDDAAKALEGLEDMYLKQTGPIRAPEHLKLAFAGKPNDAPAETDKTQSEKERAGGNLV